MKRAAHVLAICGTNRSVEPLEVNRRPWKISNVYAKVKGSADRFFFSFFSFFIFFFHFTSSLYANCSICQGMSRARIRVCLVQLYVRSLMRMAGRYYRHKAYVINAFIAPSLTINNLLASLFVNYTIKHSLCYSDLRDTHCIVKRWFLTRSKRTAVITSTIF